MLKITLDNTKTNNSNYKKPENISTKYKRKLSTKDYYIKLLESNQKYLVMNKLFLLQLAKIYMMNDNNIYKLENEQKCILSYTDSVFAKKENLFLLTNLKISIEQFFKNHKKNIQDVVKFFKPKPFISPEQMFKKTHNPPP